MTAQTRNIVLLGAGGHCKSCIDLVESTECYSILGIIDKTLPANSDFLGYRILGDDDCLLEFRNHAEFALVATGQIRSPLIRIRLYELLTNAGFQTPALISPFAYVSKHAKVMDGSTVHHGAIINAYAYIGHNSIINSQALIEHDTCIGPHCHISTGAKLNGNVSVDSGTFIGSGAIIGNDVQIGPNCVISAGSVVLRDLPPSTWVRNTQTPKP
jgi:sugar O-acyltransferase (sialic acid O-acetyltransferase NeuD family)